MNNVFPTSGRLGRLGRILGTGNRSRVRNSFGWQDRDKNDGDGERNQRHRGQRGGEIGIADVGDRPDDHVLRVAGDGGDTAGIGGYGDGEEVGYRIPLEPPDKIEDQRRHHQADRVVDQEGGEKAGDQNDGREQDERMTRPDHDEAIDHPEEAGEA